MKTTLKEKVNETRRGYIIDAAMKAAGKKGGFHTLTREVIATEAGVSPPLVTRYLGGMETIRNLVMTEAVARGDVAIVAQGLTSGHPAAVAAPVSVKRKVQQSIK